MHINDSKHANYIQPLWIWTWRKIEPLGQISKKDFIPFSPLWCGYQCACTAKHVYNIFSYISPLCYLKSASPDKFLFVKTEEFVTYLFSSFLFSSTCDILPSDFSVATSTQSPDRKWQLSHVLAPCKRDGKKGEEL